MKPHKCKHIWKYLRTLRTDGVWIKIYRCDLCDARYGERFVRDTEDPTNGTWEQFPLTTEP